MGGIDSPPRPALGDISIEFGRCGTTFSRDLILGGIDSPPNRRLTPSGRYASPLAPSALRGSNGGFSSTPSAAKLGFEPTKGY